LKRNKKKNKKNKKKRTPNNFREEAKKKSGNKRNKRSEMWTIKLSMKAQTPWFERHQRAGVCLVLARFIAHR
jgi:hypothetical protein